MPGRGLPIGTFCPATETLTSTSTPSSLPSCWESLPSCSDSLPSCGDPDSLELEAVSEPELSEERLEEELLVLRLLGLDGIPGSPVLDEDEEELEGMDGIEEAVEEEELEGEGEDDEEEEELGIDGEEDEDGDDDALGMDGMPLLLLELCWVDSQPARTRASTEAPTKPALRMLNAMRMERRMEAAVFMVASLVI